MRKIMILVVIIASVLTSCKPIGKSYTENSLNYDGVSEIYDSAEIDGDFSRTVNENCSTESLPNDELLAQFMSGNVSNVAEEESEFVKELSQYKTGWVQTDVNKDGFDDLILQDGEDYCYSIIAIVSAETGKIRCRYLDNGDTTSFSIISKNENLIYCSFDYGIFDRAFYQYFVFNDRWEKQKPCSLIVRNDYNEEDMGVGKTTYEMHIVKVGPDGTEYIDKLIITKKQFVDKFQEITGSDFDDIKPESFILWN